MVLNSRIRTLSGISVPYESHHGTEMSIDDASLEKMMFPPPAPPPKNSQEFQYPIPTY